MQMEEIQRLKNTLEEPWQQDHRQAMRAWDWDFIVVKALHLADFVELGWEITCREAVTEGIPDLKARTTEMRVAFDQTIEELRKIRDSARAFTDRTGHTINRLEELQTVTEELQRKRDKYLFRLALIDDDLINEAVAEHAAGHYPSPGAALADRLAARHAERITPPYSELRNWAAQSLPPAGWHEESDHPE
jgi:hypothetical protein